MNQTTKKLTTDAMILGALCSVLSGLKVAIPALSLSEVECWHLGRNIIDQAESQALEIQTLKAKLATIESSHEYKLGLAINRAAGSLPFAYHIEIKVEEGCGEVDLYDVNYDKVALDQDDMPMHQQVTEAIDAAIAAMNAVVPA